MMLPVRQSTSVSALRGPQAPLAEDPSYWGRVLGIGSLSMSMSMSFPPSPPTGGGNSVS